MSMDFTDQRLSYEKGELDQQSVPASPLELLKGWMNEAIAQKVQEPYAMSMAMAFCTYWLPKVRSRL
ncbi:MAG: hypothetical protein L0H51_02830, partial [Psychrobacter sp.]|nr:hypothetical protein [Psychrobacter sp.]